MTGEPSTNGRTPEEIAATVRKLEAEASKAEAEAAKVNLEAEVTKLSVRRTAADVQLLEIDLERDQYKRDKELVDDEHNRVYRITESINENTAKACMAQLQTWSRMDNGSARDITIYFTSPGGQLVPGLALWDFLRGLRRDGHHITTVSLGYAASMAGILLQAGDVRVMGAESWLLIHQVQFGAIGCPSPGLRVLTDDLRWVPAGELEVGDTLLAFDENAPAGSGHSRCWRLADVEAIGRAMLPSSRVYLDNGQSLVVSDNHPWLASYHYKNGNHSNYWLETREFPEYPNYSSSRTRRTTLPQVMAVQDRIEDWEAGYIGGLLDGEGSLENKSCRVSFAQKPGVVLDGFYSWMDRNGFLVKDYGDATCSGQNNDCRHVRVYGSDDRVSGFRETTRLLMATRPARLLDKFVQSVDGRRMYHRGNINVEYIEPLGPQEVVTLKTSTGTFVGEGFPMHNSWGEVEDTTKWVERIQDRILDIFAERSTLSKAQLKRRWSRRDWWCSSDDALKYGFIDEIW